MVAEEEERGPSYSALDAYTGDPAKLLNLSAVQFSCQAQISAFPQRQPPNAPIWSFARQWTPFSGATRLSVRAIPLRV